MAGTRTFLSTSLSGASGDGNASAERRAAVERHSQLLQATIAAQNGTLVTSDEDGIVASFEATAQALEAAVAIQRACAAQPVKKGGGLRSALALHTGQADERAAEPYGQTLQRTERLLAVGHPGQILLSGATRITLSDQLPAGVTLRDLGERRLKGQTAPEHIFQLVVEGLPAEFPPLRTLDSRPTNIPTQQTAFIGRTQEIAQITAWLRRPDVQLLTLTGPGGTGKTRLCLEVAANLLHEFDDGAFLVALTPISEVALVVPTIAKVLGVDDTGDQDLLELIKNHLRPKKILLIIDNLEHVRASSAVLTELLAAAPRLKLMVTSRVRLRIPGEYQLHIPPFDLPKLGELPPFEQLAQYEAIQLFVERAQSLKPDFALTPENAATIAEICHRLDGLPLAIELAAARTRILRPQALLTRLEHRLKTLVGGAFDLPERQQALRTALDGSFEILNADERLLFTRIAVFAGSWTLESLKAICGTGLADVQETLNGLLDHSLVRQEAPSGDQPQRYSSLELIQEYAMERLLASEEASHIRQKHAEHYLTLAELAEPALHGPEQLRWLNQLEREHDNLRAALHWSLNNGQARIALHLVSALSRFWHLRYYITEGRNWLESALIISEDIRTVTRVKACCGAGWIAAYQGDIRRARLYFEQGLECARAIEDQYSIGIALGGLTQMLRSVGEEQAAQAACAEALEIFIRLDEHEEIAWCYIRQALLAVDEGDYAQALATCQQGIDLFKQTSYDWGYHSALGFLGNIYMEQGQYVPAMQIFEQIWSYFQQIGDKISQADARSHIGRAALCLGDLERAVVCCREALGVYRESGLRSRCIEPLEQIAEILAQRRQPIDAVLLWGAIVACGFSLRDFDKPYKSQSQLSIVNMQSLLNAETWEQAWVRGSTMTLEQAVVYAYETLDRLSAG